MTRVLLRARQRSHFRLVWSITIGVILVLVTAWVYKAASNVRTHTLPVGGIKLSVPYSKYLVNEPITFTITNLYNSPIYIANACPSEPLSVYRQVNGVWVRLHDTATAKGCSKEDRRIVVPANGFVNGNFSAWPHLFNQPGHYRVVAYVEYYSALEFQEFDVIAVPPPFIAALSPAATTAAGQTSNNPGASSATTANRSTTATGSRPAPTYAPQHYQITVDRYGNYNTTNLNLHVGDILTIVYTQQGPDEIQTNFTPLSPSTPGIDSVTVDHENTSRSIILRSKGTWRYSAAPDITTGNSGTLNVN